MGDAHRSCILPFQGWHVGEFLIEDVIAIICCPVKGSTKGGISVYNQIL